MTHFDEGLNAPTGAWCSLTKCPFTLSENSFPSQCTYRCVVLPDFPMSVCFWQWSSVSMHLQVRGAP